MNDVFERKQLDKTRVGYIETHGTGTVAGDKQELQGLYNVYKDSGNKIIGSVKSNMGHCEGASGLISLVKTLLMFENNVILPNCDFQTSPHEFINNGFFSVKTDVVEDYPLDMIQINNFGFGGTNAVAILEKNHVETSTSEKANAIVGFTNDKKQEGVKLQSQVDLGNHIGFKYFFTKDGKKHKTIQNTTAIEKIAFVFPGQGSQWKDMGKALFQENEIFHDSIQRMDHFYPGLCDLYRSGDKWFDKQLTVIGIASFQVAVVNCLMASGIKPDYIVGHSLGEIASAYAAGLVDEEQVIKIAMVRSFLSKRIDKTKCIVIDQDKLFREEPAGYQPLEGEEKWEIEGQMVVVGMESDKIQAYLDDNHLDQTCIACYNSPSGQTVSGPKTQVVRLCELIKQDVPDCFIHVVPTDGVAYHSKLLGFYEDEVTEKFFTYMSDFEPVETESRNWLSTCGQTHHGIQYHVKNITQPVYFQQTIERLAPGTLVVEMGPSSPMLSQISRIRKDLVLCGLVNKSKPGENVKNLIDPLFTLALYGYCNIKPESIKAECLTTGRLSMSNYDAIWDHSHPFYIPSYKDYEFSSATGTEIKFDLTKKWSTIRDHVVDNHNLFPAMGYIFIIWKYFEGKPIDIKDFKIDEALMLNESMKSVSFNVVLEEGTKIKIFYDEKLKAQAVVVPIEPEGEFAAIQFKMDGARLNFTVGFDAMGTCMATSTGSCLV